MRCRAEVKGRLATGADVKTRTAGLGYAPLHWASWCGRYRYHHVPDGCRCKFDRSDPVSMAFEGISYSNRPGEVDFFRNIGTLPRPVLMKLWYTDEAGNISECAAHAAPGGEQDENAWRKTHWDEFHRDITFKTNDWEHEQECRLILNAGMQGSLADHRRTLTYDFDLLKGVIFGIRTADEDKMNMIEIIRKKCQERNRGDFEFYQAYYNPEQGDIRRFELRLNLIVEGEGSNS